MESKAKHTPSRHVLVFDHPRSCSNLLGKLLDTHPDVIRLHRPWRDARTRGPDTPGLSFTLETGDRFKRKYEAAPQAGPPKDFSQETLVKANERVAEMIETARAEARSQSSHGKLAVFQEHTAVVPTNEIVHQVLEDPTWMPLVDHPNITIIRDDILQNSIPVMLIRHPALAIASFLRMQLLEEMLVPADEMFKYWISYRWMRIVYEDLTALSRKTNSNVHEPVIIDASDLVYNTTPVLSKLCDLFQIPQGQIEETWNPETNVIKHTDIEAVWVEKLQKSSGVIRGKKTVADEDIRIEDLVPKWEEGFGKDYAGELWEMVEREMADYCWLWERRMKV